MTLSTALTWLGCAFGLPGGFFTVRFILFRSPEDDRLSDGFVAAAMWCLFLILAIERSMWTGLVGLVAAWATYCWWKKRRKGRGKKALKQLGAKSRARVEALVRQMTPSPIPTPVPGGAR